MMQLTQSMPVVKQHPRRLQVLTAMLLALVLMITSSTQIAEAKGTRGKITGKTVAAGALSLIIWPGIGQAVNSQPGKKVATHAIIGLIPPFRFWSGYDALFDRQGGYWEGRI
jgi:hypothetical protein